jgi:SAM-dependent methyltransferase
VSQGEFEDPRLVEVYDAEHVWGWDDDFFMAVLAERSAPRVLDFGCGTGRLAIAMALAGHEVTAVDPAAAALDAARRKPGAERVRWIPGSSEAPAASAYDAALLAGHVAQFFVGDREWSAALRALRRSLDRGGRLIFCSRDPSFRRWESWNPVDSRRLIFLPGGGTVDAWSQVTDVREQGDGAVVSVARHYAFPDGEELVSDVTLRFRTEQELRSTVEDAGFDIDRVYGGWQREPAGLGNDGELIFLAVARPGGRRG